MNQDWEIKDFEDCLDKLPSSKKIPRKKFLTSGKYPIICLVSSESTFTGMPQTVTLPEDAGM